VRYPQEFIEKVSESSSLVEVISQYTQLKPSGGGFMGRCPFPDHQEKTASFSVSDAKQVYHCFGCKKSGNIFRFLQDYNGMNFPEALEYLADKHGIPIPQDTSGHKDQNTLNFDKKKLMLKANKLAAEFYQEILKRSPADSPIKQYVQKRKLSAETLQEFQIGFSPTEWESLANHLTQHQISLELAEEVKLVKARKENNGYFDLFRDRLMFPIHSASGEVLAFGGRIHDQGEPKYLNSPETYVFSKGKVLYGLSQTAKYIRTEDCVVIVEGYMDLVSLYQSGIKNIAATMGTALTADHAKLIKRMTTNVVVLFDSDDAGQAAAERSLTILLSQGLFPKGLVLTDAKDPDEFIQKFGADELQKKIVSAPELFSVVLQTWTTDYRAEASQKVKLVDKVKPVFESIQDPRLKSLYAEELAGRMNVTLSWLRSAFMSKNSVNNAQGRTFVLPQVSSNSGMQVSSTDLQDAIEVDKIPKIQLQNAPHVELLLLQLALKSRANFEWILNQPEPHTIKQIVSQITDLAVKDLMEKIEQVYRQDVNKFDKFFSLLIEKIDRPELLFDKANLTEFDFEKEQKFLSDTIKKIQQNYLRTQAKKMVNEIKHHKAGADSSVNIEKLKEFSDLQKNRLALKK
jgi:DNA primase